MVFSKNNNDNHIPVVVNPTPKWRLFCHHSKKNKKILPTIDEKKIFSSSLDTQSTKRREHVSSGCSSSNNVSSDEKYDCCPPLPQIQQRKQEINGNNEDSMSVYTYLNAAENAYANLTPESDDDDNCYYPRMGEDYSSFSMLSMDLSLMRERQLQQISLKNRSTHIRQQKQNKRQSEVSKPSLTDESMYTTTNFRSSKQMILLKNTSFHSISEFPTTNTEKRSTNITAKRHYKAESSSATKNQIQKDNDHDDDDDRYKQNQEHHLPASSFRIFNEEGRNNRISILTMDPALLQSDNRPTSSLHIVNEKEGHNRKSISVLTMEPALLQWDDNSNNEDDIEISDMTAPRMSSPRSKYDGVKFINEEFPLVAEFQYIEI